MAITPRLLSRAPMVAVVASLAVLAACGGSGEGDKSPAQILQDSAAAVKAVSSYHVSASVSGGSGSSSNATFDFHVAGPGTVTGSLTSGGATVDIIVVNGNTYFKGKDFFAEFSPDAANLVGDSWVLIPASQASSVTQGLDTFTDTSKLGACVSSIAGGSFTKSTGTADNESVVTLQSSMGYSISIASGGTPYPVQITGGGSANLSSSCGSSSSGSSGGGSINFDSWGQTVTVTPPPNPLDLSSITGSGGTGSGGSTPQATPTPT